MKNNNENHSSKALIRRFKPLKTFIFSRMFVIFTLLLIQINIFALPVIFCYTRYLQIIMLVGIITSILFCFYLINAPGKNEFKIAWLIPIMIMPVFGISLYLMFKTNRRGSRFIEKLKKIKCYSLPFLADLTTEEKALKAFPDLDDISRYLKNNAGFSTFTNTETQYFSSCESSFFKILQDLRSAEKFIFLEFFVIEESTMWFEILQILCEKVNQGIEVFVLFDSLGSVSIATKKYEDYLKSLGINAKIFSPFTPVYDTGLNNRDHRKLINIDGKIAWTGGFNISDEYLNINHKRFNYWKDSGIRLEGPAVRTFTTTFLQLWYLQNNKTDLNFHDFDRFVNIPSHRKNQDGIVIPYGDDAYSSADIAEDVYNYIFAKAKKYVHIMTPYFVIDNTMMNAMVFAAKRGVRVELIVPSHYDHLLVFAVGRRFIKQLIQNGVHVYTYEPGFMHSKVFISDDMRGTVGSINVDYRSLYHHFECGAYLYKTSTLEQMENDFQKTKKQCKELTYLRYKKIPAGIRLTGWIFKVFAPLL